MRWRRVIGFLALAFAVFFIFSAPTEAAAMIRGTVTVAGSLLTSAAQALATFLRALI